ncbi:sphingosine kinase 2 [Brachyhypopomus gauderio]|uniref:sphingosine kinase 2 n=1 Tax=Brachyhypopomus gauderio TaxID=698409 RepID=UPI004042F601
MRSPGPQGPSPSPPPVPPPGMAQEALLHGQFTGWSTGGSGGGAGGGSGSSSSSCPSTPTGVSLPLSPASCSYALTLTPTHIHVQRLTPRPGKDSRLLLPLAELTGSSCPRAPAPPLLVLYWYPPRRRRRGVSRRRHVHAYQAESRPEAERWNTAVQCLLRGLDITATTEFSKSMLPRPRRLLLLVNPFSGRGQAMDWCQTHILPMIREANISYNLIPTKYPSHARELMREITLREWDGIIIASGDGLLHEVVNGLMDRPDWEQAIKTPVGVLPCGSGNALAGSINHYAGYDMCLREPLLLNCCFLLCRGGVRPMDLVSVTTSPLPASSSNQNGRPSTSTRLFSFLSVAWGFVSDVDIESERYRGLGSARFTLGTLVRLASLRSYQGRLSYLPPAVVAPAPDSAPQPPRRPLSRSITEGLEGVCRTPIHRTCSDMGISEQRSLRKGEREREREEREQERERRRERARGTGVVRASSLAEDREREMEAEERIEEQSGFSSQSNERQECDRNVSEHTHGGAEEERGGRREKERQMDEERDVREEYSVDEGKEAEECEGSSADTPPDPRWTLRKNSAPSTQIVDAFFSQPMSMDLVTEVDGQENGSCFQQQTYLLDPGRERSLTISSPFRQSPFSYKPKLDQNQNQSPSRPRPVSLLQHAHTNSLPPKFPPLSLSQSPTPPSCTSPPNSAYLVPQPNTPGPASPSPSPSLSSSFSFDLAEPAGPLTSSFSHPPHDDLLPPLDQPLPSRDWVTVEGDFVLVLAIYQSHLGADLLAAPQARFDDGLIHLTFVRAGISRATLLRLFLAMERGGHLGLSSPYVSHVSARAFRLQPLSPRGTLTVDGELVPYGPLQAQIHPSMARLIVGDSGVKVTRF